MSYRCCCSGPENAALLRRAIEVWRIVPNDVFVHIFQSQWKVLPEDEATEVAREIVRVTLSKPDSQVMATYDAEQQVRITSMHQATVFSILHVLRHLGGPELAESVIAQHEQLAAAVRRFPNGMQSVIEEADLRRRARRHPAAVAADTS